MAASLPPCRASASPEGDGYPDTCQPRPSPGVTPATAYVSRRAPHSLDETRPRRIRPTRSQRGRRHQGSSARASTPVRHRASRSAEGAQRRSHRGQDRRRRGSGRRSQYRLCRRGRSMGPRPHGPGQLRRHLRRRRPPAFRGCYRRRRECVARRERLASRPGRRLRGGEGRRYGGAERRHDAAPHQRGPHP
jgi:hypothetical protein